MSQSSTSEQPALESVARTAGDYHPSACLFVIRGVISASERKQRRLMRRGKSITSAKARHVTGKQICEELASIAEKRWGPLAWLVLSEWGVRSTYDFGRIVYALIDANHLKRRPGDSIEDFRDVFDLRRRLIVSTT